MHIYLRPPPWLCAELLPCALPALRVPPLNEPALRVLPALRVAPLNALPVLREVFPLKVLLRELLLLKELPLL